MSVRFFVARFGLLAAAAVCVLTAFAGGAGARSQCNIGVITNSRPPAISPGSLTAGGAINATDWGGWGWCGDQITDYMWQFVRDGGTVVSSGDGISLPSYGTSA